MGWVRCGLGTPSNILALPTPSEASGAIAQFNTDLTENLLSAVAEFSTSQASGTPTPAAPIPIVGVDKVYVSRTGKNLFDKTKITIGERFATTGTVNVSNTYFRSDWILVKPNTKYYIQKVVPNSSSYSGVFWYDKDKNFISAQGGSGTAGTGINLAVTSPSNAYYVGLNCYVTEVDSVQLELGETATTYEPYNGTTALINLGGTYYGGSVDAVTGKITKKWLLTEIDENSDITWRADSNVAKIDVASPYLKYRAGGEDAKSNELEFMRVTGLDGVTEEHFAVLNNSGSNTATAVVWKVTGITSKADMLTWLSTHPLQILTNIATPETEYASNTAEIPTIVGDNQVFADTGDVVVKYFETVGHKI